MPITNLVLAASLLLTPQREFKSTFNFYSHGPYEAAVPRPESVLGYLGGQHHTNFRDQEKVYAAIHAAAPKKTKVFEYGKSWEGRPLRLFVVSSEKNIARLEETRKHMVELGSGKPSASAHIPKLPAIVWVNETVHGNESASFESGMFLAYNLAASKNKDITSALDDVVVIINPVFNPDGHERFVVWNRSIAVGTAFEGSYEYSEPSWVHGRTNHYRFDMNRDRVAMSQAETQAEAAELRRWYPQVYLDQHGQTSEYFFPPVSMSVNENADRDRIEKWTQVFGRANAKAFDSKGWLYFTRDTFDFYYPGYLDTYSTYVGAIGMTYETDGGRVLNGTKNDGTPLTLELGMAKHFTTGITAVKVAKANRVELLESFASYKRRAVTGEHAGRFKRIIVRGGLRALTRLQEQLARAGIESAFAVESVEHKNSTSYWDGKVSSVSTKSGDLIIDMAQNMGQFAKAVLEPGQNFEAEFTKEQLEIIRKSISKEPDFGQSEGTGFYDITGWSPVYGHQLEAYWTDAIPSVKTTLSREVAQFQLPKSDIGWLIRYTDLADILAVHKAAARGVRTRTVVKDVKVGNLTVKRGDFIVFKDRNDDNAPQILEEELSKTWAEVHGISSGFSESMKGNLGLDALPIRKPKVGVVFGATDWTSSFGHTWFVLERELGIEFVPLHNNALNRDLSEFSAILFPQGRYGTPSAELLKWVRGGGCAIVFGGSWALGDGKLLKLDSVELPDKKEIQSIPGTMFRAELDDRSFLANGYGARENHKIPFAVQVDGDSFYKAPEGVNPVVAFSKDDKKLLSGWAWPDNSELALKESVCVAETGLGGGRVVWFAWDPCERAMWPGSYKMLMNAILLGPN